MNALRWSAGALLVSASVGEAQGRLIRGVVVDSAGAPVPYANVISTGSGRRVAAAAVMLIWTKWVTRRRREVTCP